VQSSRTRRAARATAHRRHRDGAEQRRPGVHRGWLHRAGSHRAVADRVARAGDGMQGARPKCPRDVPDGLPWISGYIEGKALREKRGEFRVVVDEDSATAGGRPVPESRQSAQRSRLSTRTHRPYTFYASVGNRSERRFGGAARSPPSSHLPCGPSRRPCTLPSQPNLLRQGRSSFCIRWCNHRVRWRQFPTLPVLLRRQLMICPQMSLQRRELFPAIQAGEVIRSH
jgi:hypothetical protein